MTSRKLYYICMGLLLAACSQPSPKVDKGLLAQAEQGDAEAQMKVGLAFDGMEDFEEAARWYALAAEQGVSEAQNNLGVLYKDGQGVGQDFEEAARWFRMAAVQGNTLSQLNLGWLYHAGKGVRQDADSARYWYTLAADKGHATARLNLGILCLQQGDTLRAIDHLRRAAGEGNEGAQHILNKMDHL